MTPQRVERLGAVSAALVALCFGLNLYANALMQRAGIHWSAAVDPAVMLPYLQGRPFAFNLYGLSYVGVDLARLGLVLVLYERFRRDSPTASRLLAAFGLAEFIAFAAVNGFLRDAFFGLGEAWSKDPAAAAASFHTAFVVLAALEWVGGVSELFWIAGIAVLCVRHQHFPRVFTYPLVAYVLLKALERAGLQLVPLYPWGTIALYAGFAVALALRARPGARSPERDPGSSTVLLGPSSS